MRADRRTDRHAEGNCSKFPNAPENSTSCPGQRLNTLYLSQNKQRSVAYTALIYYFAVAEPECVYCAVRAENLNIIRVYSSI